MSNDTAAKGRPDMTDVVITGVGLVVPGANTLAALGCAVRAGRSAITPIDRFDTAEMGCSSAGIVDDRELQTLPQRLRRKMDRFCSLSMVAAERALTSAGLDGPSSDPGTSACGLDTSLNPERTGVYFANMYGGWELTEESMRRLCAIGYAGVSAHIASAWFPTASQGQISIRWGLRGFSKTIVADTASGMLALGYAAEAIRAGRADVILAGGAEAPVTPYTMTFCTTSGRMSGTEYRPHTHEANGFVVGEGAVVLVLESRAHAEARGATILAQWTGFATGHAPGGVVLGDAGDQPLAEVLADAVQASGASVHDIDYVGLDAQGSRAADDAELRALELLMGRRASDVRKASVKPLTGHLLGAAGAAEVAAAVHELVSTQHTEDPVGTALVTARGADGTLAGCVLRAA